MPSLLCLQCFDAVGWAAGRAFGLYKPEWWGAGVVICLERGAYLHMAQLMPLPLAVSCSSKIRIGFLPFWYRLTRVVPDKGSLNRCVCVCVFLRYLFACDLSFTFCDFDTMAFLIVSTVVIHRMLLLISYADLQ